MSEAILPRPQGLNSRGVDVSQLLARRAVDTGRLRLVRGMPASGVAVGPGAGRLTSFLHQAAPNLDMAAPSDTGDTVMDDARRATVHVICWY